MKRHNKDLKAKHLWLTEKDRNTLKEFRENTGAISDNAAIRTAIHVASKNLGVKK